MAESLGKLSACSRLNGKLAIDVKQDKGQYKSQNINAEAQICSVTLDPGLWLLIGFVDVVETKDHVYNNILLGQNIRNNMIGGGGCINVVFKGIYNTATKIGLYTYDYQDVVNTYRGILTAIRLEGVK